MRQARWIKAGAMRSTQGWSTGSRLTRHGRENPTEILREMLGEVPPGSLVERSGVEVVLMTSSDKSLRFADGTPEAEDLKRFVQAQGQEL